jgi:signal transduction histidine kinase
MSATAWRVAGSLASRISDASTLEEICDCVLDEAAALAEATCAEILVRDNETRELTCLAHRGPFPWCSAELDGQRMGAKLFQLATEDVEAVVIPGIEDEERVEVKVPPSGQLRKAICIPLRVRGQIIGAMNFCGDEDAPFSDESVQVLELLASMAALAIENAYLYQEVDSKARLRRQLLAREIKVQEEERRRIARELHDEAGQSLTGLIMSLDAIDQALSSHQQENTDHRVRSYVREAREIASSTLQEIRHVIFDLRPTLLDDLGLAAAVDWYVKTFLAKAGIEAEVKAEDLEGRLPQKVEIALYRIIQEAIGNVIKHSFARKCAVTLTCADGTVEAAIEDDGKGFDRERIASSGEEHLGIAGMQERARSLNGQFAIHSRAGEGTCVQISIPLPAGGTNVEDPGSAG